MVTYSQIYATVSSGKNGPFFPPRDMTLLEFIIGCDMKEDINTETQKLTEEENTFKDLSDNSLLNKVLIIAV
jgi:hypothetical protein